MRSGLSAITCVGAVAAVLTAPSRGHAAEAPLYVSLSYALEGTAQGCWDERKFRQSVVQSVGYDPFRADAPITVQVQIGGNASLVDGRVEWRNAAGAGMGERRFRAKDGDCAKLLTEMSFAVGLQIELLHPKQSAEAAAKTTTANATPSPTQPAVVSKAASSSASKAASTTAAVQDVTADKAASSVSQPWHMWVGVGPSLAWGLAPSLTAQGRLFFGVRRNDLSVELGAEGTWPVTEHQMDGSGFRQSLLGASASLCGHHRALSACLLGKASQLRVSGLGVDQPRSPNAFVAQAGVRLAATWQAVGPWFVTPHIDTLGLLTPRVIALNEADAWEMPRFSLLAGIDVAARFR